MSESYHEPMPQVWRATDLRAPARPEWIARDRLPRSAVTVLVGDEGIGKSLFWVFLVLYITTGMPMPQFGIPAREAADVVLVLTEDEWSSTVRPRLEAAGVDLSRVHVICAEDDGSGTPVFAAGLNMHLILDMPQRPALVVLDAFLDTVPSGLAMRDPQQARRALHPWKELATATGAAVLLLTHTNRMDVRSARDKYGISGELRKKARMTLYAQQDDDGALVIGPEKTNVTKLVPASRFTIEPVPFFAADDDGDGTVPRLRYAGEADKSAREIVAERYEAEHVDDRDDRTEAEVWLEDFIASKGGSVESAEAKREAQKVRISERTLKRAAGNLGVTYEHHGFPRRTYWCLDSGASQATDDPCLSERGPTGPTGPDLHKHDGPTARSGQSGHAQTHGPTGGPTAQSVHPIAEHNVALAALAGTGRMCSQCLEPLSGAREAAGFTICADCRRREALGA